MSSCQPGVGELIRVLQTPPEFSSDIDVLFAIKIFGAIASVSNAGSGSSLFYVKMLSVRAAEFG